MLPILLRRSFLLELPFIYQFCSLYTLANKMSEDNVIQLCGLDTKAIHRALACLKKGQIIGVPTDTVFGLAVDAANSSAIAKLYEVKGRDAKKPLAICVKSVGDIKKWGVTDDLPKGLLKKLLPGPVTVLLNRKDKLNPDLNPGVKKVGIRVPGTTWYPFLQFVTSAHGYPLALTSANLSNEPNCLVADEFKDLWPKLGAVFDSRDFKVEETNLAREGSTIVDLSVAGKFEITRPGVGYGDTLKTLTAFGLEPIQ